MNLPRETRNLDIYGSPPIEWDRVVQALDGAGDLAVEDSASHYWLGTTRPDGRTSWPWASSGTMAGVATRDPHGATRWRL